MKKVQALTLCFSRETPNVGLSSDEMKDATIIIATSKKYMAIAIDTNSLVALRATKLLLTPTQSREYNIILITAQYQ